MVLGRTRRATCLLWALVLADSRHHPRQPRRTLPELPEVLVGSPQVLHRNLAQHLRQQ